MRVLRILKWGVITLLVVTVLSVYHYSLPRTEVMRVIGVLQRLENLGWNRMFFAGQRSGQLEQGIEPGVESRDVRYVEAIRPNGNELILRNEDTGWIWPPYFKFDSADMQARARDMASPEDNPQWVAVTYYGVRSQLISIYPNVIRLRRVDGPDVRIIPWTRIIVGLMLVAGAAWIWLRFFRRREELRVKAAVANANDAERARRMPEGLFGRLWFRMTGQ